MASQPVQDILDTILSAYKMVGKDSTQLMTAFTKALIAAIEEQQKLGRAPFIPDHLKMKEGEGSEFIPTEDWPPKPKL